MDNKPIPHAGLRELALFAGAGGACMAHTAQGNEHLNERKQNNGRHID